MHTIIGIKENWLLGAIVDVQALETLATKEFLGIPAEMGTTSEVNARSFALPKHFGEFENSWSVGTLFTRRLLSKTVWRRNGS